MKISVIIPTYRRHAYLFNMLEDLRSQTVPPDEVLVVDQTPEEERPPRFYDHWKEWKILKIIDLAECGTCVSRNQAIRKAYGDWLLFLDDDLRFRRNLISEYIRVATETKADVVHGGVITRPGSATEVIDWDILELPKEKVQNPKNDPIMALISSPNHSRRSMCIGVASGNCLVKHDIVLRVGGFDETFNDGVLDDADFGLRLYNAGAILVYDPAPFVLHLKARDGGRRITFKSYLSQVFRPEPRPNVLVFFGRHWPGWGYKMIRWKYRRQALGFGWASRFEFWRAPLDFVRYIRACREAERRLKRGSRLLGSFQGE
jgi:GT2 family glycosyltransferase